MYSASTLKSISKQANLVRQDESDPTIYRVFPDGDGGSKAQITLTVEQFQTAGIDIDSIYTINTNEFNLYTTIQPITVLQKNIKPYRNKNPKRRKKTDNDQQQEPSKTEI